jgi:hypothetical protein
MDMQSEPASPGAAGDTLLDSYASPTLSKPHRRGAARWEGHSSSRGGESKALPSAPAAGYVTIPVAAAMTGYTPKAIRRKIEAGVWLEGREFRRAPDGHVLISVKGYELWVERGRA